MSSERTYRTAQPVENGVDSVQVDFFSARRNDWLWRDVWGSVAHVVVGVSIKLGRRRPGTAVLGSVEEVRGRMGMYEPIGML
jgi:hypothetical protein